MDGKKQSAITEIHIDEATFHNVTIEPTYINFFYGKNGAGKSTIANAIDRKDSNIEFIDGRPADEFNILLYNQDFVRKNIKDDTELPGVFTVKEEDIEKKDQIDKKIKELKTLSEKKTDKDDERKKLSDQEVKLTSDFQDTCFSVTKDIREKFDATQEGRKRNKPAFVADILNAPAQEQDLTKLKELYDTAYDKSIKPLDFLVEARTFNYEYMKDGYELLGKHVVGTSDSTFAKFIEQIDAYDWVGAGYGRFKNTPGGKCPFCQQRLPDNFYNVLAECFNTTYDEAIKSLYLFSQSYKSDVNSIINLLKGNNTSQLPQSFDMQEYFDLLSLLEKTIDANFSKIDTKLSSPGTIIAIDDINPIIERINKIIQDTNNQIREINNIVNDRRTKQSECTSMVWQHMHYFLADTIAQYEKNRGELRKKAEDISKEVSSIEEQSAILKQEIETLSSDMSNVTDTINGINKLLRESGFQGFRLREAKPKPTHIVKADGSIDSRILVPVDGIKQYEIERLDGSPAHGLSEGERNFIAFLYFYHKVKGSDTENADLCKRVVVIDDPVTSMDSSSMFIVSSLIREMIENCYASLSLDGYDKLNYHIQQIFLMTHNAYFHREITYNQTAPDRFEGVTFFHVKKPRNDSIVKPCVDTDPLSPTPAYPFNYNPVKNSYAALWDEYKEVDSATAAINVIRRILEYYFVQLCGYDRYDFSDKILKDHRKEFVIDEGLPTEDMSRYIIAASMLQYLTTSSFSPNDDMYSIEDAWDIKQCQEIFKDIFDAMDQSQHYNAMMGNK